MGVFSKAAGDTGSSESIEAGMGVEDYIISEPVVSIKEDFQGNYFAMMILLKAFLTVNILTLQDILISCLCRIQISHIYLYISRRKNESE